MKNQSMWNVIISIITILLLLSLLSISFFSLFYNFDNCSITESTTIFAFIISSYAIFIATAVFLPKYTLKQAVEEEVARRIDEEKKTNQINKVELLRIEAHECRMISYFLANGKTNIEWSFGWTIKSLKTYMKLYMEKPYRYEEFISQDLTNRLEEISEKLKSKSNDLGDKDNADLAQSFINIRKWKDFFECIIIYKKLSGEGKKFSGEEKENFELGIDAFSTFFNKAIEILKIQVKNEKNFDKNGLNDLKKRIRIVDNQAYKVFVSFLERPDGFSKIEDFTNQIK